MDDDTKWMLDHMRETILADRTELKMRVRELEAAQDAWRYSYEQQHVSLQKCLEENARLALERSAESRYAQELKAALAEERALGDELAEIVKGFTSWEGQHPAMERWRAARQKDN